MIERACSALWLGLFMATVILAELGYLDAATGCLSALAALTVAVVGWIVYGAARL